MGAGNAGRSSAGAAWTFNCWTIPPASKRTFSFRRNSCAPVSHLHLMLSLSLWSSTFSWRLTPAFDGSLNYFYPLVSKKPKSDTWSISPLNATNLSWLTQGTLLFCIYRSKSLLKISQHTFSKIPLSEFWFLLTIGHLTVRLCHIAVILLT